MNCRALTLVTDAEVAMPAVVVGPNEAVPIGTVAGVQFVAALKLPLPGLPSHVAFWAAAPSGERQVPASSRPAKGRRQANPDCPTKAVIVLPRTKLPVAPRCRGMRGKG